MAFQVLRFDIVIHTPVAGETVLGPKVKVEVTAVAVVRTGEGIEETRPVESLTLAMTGVPPQTFNKHSVSTTFISSNPGPKTITATAKFFGKQGSLERKFTLIIDQDPPVISVTTPSNNQVINGPGPAFSVQVKVTASDASKITKVQLGVGDVVQENINVTPPESQTTFKRKLNLPGLNGHVITISATDEHGNSGSVTIPVTTADTGPPDLRITSHPTDRPTTVTWSNERVEVEIAGSATDPTTKVKAVEWQLHEGELHEDRWEEAANVSGTWSIWKATVELTSPGVHVVAVRAIDGAGNVDLVRVSFDVAIQFELEDLTFGGYLVDLMAFATRRLRAIGDTAPIDEQLLQSTFHQPYAVLEDALLKATDLGKAAGLPIGQVQIAIEVLRSYLNNFVEIPRYCETAYKSVLVNLGTSYEELRLSRVAHEPSRRRDAVGESEETPRDALARRLGIETADLEILFLTPDEMTEPNLQSVFGLADTTRPDPLSTRGEPKLLGLRLAYLHSSWHERDQQEHAQGRYTLPIIDPDIVSVPKEGQDPSEGDLLITNKGNVAFDLWKARTAWVSERDAAIRKAREDANTVQEGFTSIMALVLPDIDLAQLEQDYADGLDIGPRLTSFHLDFNAFFLLVGTRQIVETGVILDSEWEDVYAALVQAAKREKFGDWIQEELDVGLTLGPTHFRRAKSPALLPWRAEPRVRRAWERKLEARIQQEQGLIEAYQATLRATEEDVLPLLRDTLIANIDRQGYPNRDLATWLTTRLSISFQYSGNQRLSRIEQAIETLQDVLFGLRTGRQEGLAPFPVGTPAPDWELATSEPDPDTGHPGYSEIDFDEEWKWMGSFASWRGAMFVFAHPENYLLPTLRPAESWTKAFAEIVALLREEPLLTRDKANELAKKYLAVLQAPTVGEGDGIQGDGIKFDIDLTSDLTKSELRERRDRSKKDLGPLVDPDSGVLSTDNTTKHLPEVYLHVPVLLAQSLERSGEYTAALDWYQTVYAFDLPLSERKIDFGLVAEEALPTVYRRTFGWLLEGLDPHTIANDRANAHTRFVLMSLVRCLLDFADAEFTRETYESIPRARLLYLRALDLLYLLEAPPAVAHWLFDEGAGTTVADASGNGHNASLHGGEWVITDGATALSLDGENDRVEIPAAPALELGTNNEDFSIVIRLFLREPFTGTFRTIVRKEAAASGEPALRILMSNSSNHIVLRLNTTSAPPAVVTSQAEIPLEHWIDVVCIKEGRRLKLYIGGQLDVETTFSGETVGGGGPFFLGGDPGHAGVNALLDDVSIYNQALSPEAVISLAGINPFPNPVVNALRTRGELNLRKLQQGLNIAGLELPRRETVAAELGISDGALIPAPTSSLRPTPYRYSALIERAKQLVAIAQQIETNYLTTLEKLDVEAYNLLRAGHDVQLTRDRIELENLRLSEADLSVGVAELQRERTQTQFDTYDSWIRTGPSYYERKMLDSYRDLKTRRNDIADLEAALTIGQAAVSAASGGWLGTGLGAGLGAIGQVAVPALLQAGATRKLNEAELQSRINEFNANFERRRDEWILQKSLAEKDLQIGEQQIAQAQIHKQIVGQERNIAQLQAEQAEAVVEFLNTKFTNVDLYEWMSGVLSDVYRYFLQQATAMALLAQDQLTFERQSRPLTLIQGDYWEPPSQTAALSQDPDRRGLTGSARLLRDVHQLDQHAFETNQRKLQLSQTFSLARLVPFEFEEFRETGVLPFATPMSLFEQDFPGHYLRLIKRVRISVVGLVSPTRGIRATLHAAGVSRVVTGNGVFRTIKVRRPAEQIAFTSPMSATGLFELQPENELLLPFETMGVDTTWELRMPQAANPFNYATLADVLFTMEYTALDSPEYRQLVIEELDRTVRAERAYSFQQDFPDLWYRLHNLDSAGEVDASFEIRQSDFPPNLTEIGIEHIVFALARSADLSFEVDVTDLRFNQAGTTGAGDSLGPARTVDGVISTRRLSGFNWKQAFSSPMPLFGRWTVTLPDTVTLPEEQDWKMHIREGRITDILFVVSYAARTPEWPV